MAVSLTFASVADDPFITLRYAANLVHGLGPVFNAGQRVQGFTSPLHLVITAALYLVPGGHALLKLKLASLVFGVLSIRQGARLVYGLDLPRWSQRVGYIAIGSCWIVAFSSGNGLETSLLMWLVVSLAHRLVIDGPDRSTFVLAGLAFAAVLTRLDALAPIVCMAGVGLLVDRSAAGPRRIAWFGGALLAAALTMVSELAYFGTVLPTTFYAKNMAPGRSYSLGLEYLVDPFQKEVSTAARPHGVVALVLCVQLTLLVLGVYAVVRRHPRCVYLVAIIVGQAAFIVSSGGDWMQGGRFEAPAVIPLVVVEVLGLAELVSLCGRHPNADLRRCAMVLGTAALVSASILPLRSVNAPIWDIRGLSDQALIGSGQYTDLSLSQIWATIPGELRCLRPGQLVATTEVGYLGFARQDLRLLDLRGLTDNTIASESPSSVKWPWGVQDPDWYLVNSVVGRVIVSQKPAVIVTFDPPSRPTILGGLYRLTKVSTFSDNTVSFYSPASSPDSCLR